MFPRHHRALAQRHNHYDRYDSDDELFLSVLPPDLRILSG